MPQLAAVVEQALDGVRRPALVLLDPELAEVDDVAEALAGQERVTLGRIGEHVEDEPRRGVVVVVPDLAGLRRAGSLLAAAGRTPDLSVVVGAATAAVPLRPVPGWPPLQIVETRLTDGVVVTRLRFAERVRVDWVVAALGRAVAPPVPAGAAGLWVGSTRPPVPPVDVAVSPTYAADDERPVDVLLQSPGSPPEPSEVTGRAPVVVADPGTPIDEALFNPIGFERFVEGPVTDLAPDARLTPALVAGLRGALGVRVTDQHRPDVVAGLAMAGVPLLGSAPSSVGPGLAALVADDVPLEPPMAREEHSVRLRRAALRAWSVPDWRHRIGARVGARPAGYPGVSVLLASKRPDRVPGALRQIARQRLDLPGAGLEVVVAAHGFEADAAVVAEALGGLPHRVLSFGAETLFGDVLRAAADAASGEVLLKVDDDDWYGPEAVADLLLARRYSGAPLVGMPAEQVYVEPADVTVRRKGPSENFGRAVAGGTLMIDRPLLREVGGFRPVRRFVDAQLLDGVLRAGAPIYRTHGLGYVLRRTASGHTWDPGVDYFLDPDACYARRDGFAPSALLEPEPEPVA